MKAASSHSPSYRIIFTLGALLMNPAVNHVSAAHPNTYLDGREITQIRRLVDAGLAPWADAYATMIAQANDALAQKPLSVTDGGMTRGHRFDYDRREPKRHDYQAAIQVCRAVRSLGLGYAFTGRADYADKAIELIRVWCLDEKTRMAPQYGNSGTIILISITIPGMLYGADLMWNHPTWPADEKAAFVDWTRRLGLNARDRKTQGNNFENWRLVLVAAAGSVTEDQALLDYAFARYKQIIPDQMDSAGRMVHELQRTTSLGYSLYAINAMVQTAEIARHHGVDLYTYRTPDGRGLELAMDTMAPYTADPTTWPYEQQGGFNGKDNVAVYELAHTFKPKPAYLAVIRKWGRPMVEMRTMGPTTLTHARRPTAAP